MHWFIDPIKYHYADFEGRIGRQEYWMWVLLYTVIYIGLAIIFDLLDFSVGADLFALAMLVPSLALASRRLHDIGRSGWWQLLMFLPIIGWIILLVWLATKTDPVDNKYGTPAVPKTKKMDTPTQPEVESTPEQS